MAMCAGCEANKQIGAVDRKCSLKGYVTITNTAMFWCPKHVMSVQEMRALYINSMKAKKEVG
jgi:hypothetical protein